MKRALTAEQRNTIVRFLEDNLAEPHNDPNDFVDILVHAAEEDQRFRTVLTEWIHRKTFFSEIAVNGYSLNDIASVYCNMRLGVLIALRLLWDEAMGMRDICLCAGQSCIAEETVLSGTPIELAVLENNGWYLYSGDPFRDTEVLDNMGGHSLYQVCEAHPGLIGLLTSDIPAGSYAERTGDSYNVWLNVDEDDEGGI